MAPINPKLTTKLTRGYSDSKHADIIQVKDVGTHGPREGLRISFRRTIRVADNDEINDLPPGLGTFPIYRTSTYKTSLPKAMRGKEGFFIPMYRTCATLLLKVTMTNDVSRTRGNVD